jgi:glyoxylase-like metal-dependent hydrolase (beta-lactamase superfamily II)
MSGHVTRIAFSLLLAGTAQAALSKPVATPPAAQAFKLGDLRLVALRDALNVVANDGKVFGTDVGPAAVAGVLREAHAPTDSLPLGVDALLVRSKDRIVLLDTGLGPSVQGALPGSLAKAGVTPAQVTDILITHSHGDHVGGLLTADGKLAFPNATIRMSDAEWAYMQAQPQPREQALVHTIAPRVKIFTPGAMAVPGIRSVPIAGHTPGHVGYEIGTGSARLLDIGDTAHSAIVSLARPDWAIGYDHDPKVGSASRRAMLKQLAASHEWVFAPHFPFPGVGRVVAKGDGFVWQPGLP